MGKDYRLTKRTIKHTLKQLVSNLQLVVVCLGQYCERAVLGVVPVAVVPRLQVELQLVAAAQRQLTEQIVAKPVVACGVVEADFKFRPWTVEEVGPVDVLLDQQRNAVGYRTSINFIRSPAACFAAQLLKICKLTFML